MQVRLLERYSELVCPEAAAKYQECYTASLARGDMVPCHDKCSKQVGPCRIAAAVAAVSMQCAVLA